MSVPVLICVIDDDEAMRVSLDNLLRSCGYDVQCFDSASAYMRSNAHPACVVCDLQMPGLSGVELKEAMMDTGDRTPVILISAFADERARARAEEAGIRCFLKKPFTGSALLDCVEAAVAT